MGTFSWYLRTVVSIMSLYICHYIVEDAVKI